MWKRNPIRLVDFCLVALVLFTLLACSGPPTPPTPRPLPTPTMPSGLAPTSTPEAVMIQPPPGYTVGEPIVIKILPAGANLDPSAPTQPSLRELPPTLPRPGLPIDPVDVRYLLIDHFGGIAGGQPSPNGRIRYCDPDQGVMSKAEEQDKANAEYELLERMPDRLRPILHRIGWAGLIRLSPEQKLRVYREAKSLLAVGVQLKADGYQFGVILFDEDAGATGGGVLVQGTVTRHGDVVVVSRTHMKPAKC